MDFLPLFADAIPGVVVGLNADEIARVRGHRGATPLRSILREALDLLVAQKRQADLEVHGDDDPDAHRLHRPAEPITLILEGRLIPWEVDPDLLDEIYGYTLDPSEQASLSWGRIIREAVRALGEHLDELAGPPATGSAPRTWPLYRPAPVASPLPAPEARASVRAWLDRRRIGA